MRSLSCLIISFILLQISSQAQQIHTGAEVIQILEKSIVNYELHELKEEIGPPEDRSNKLNLNEYYRVEEGEAIKVNEYEYSKKVLTLSKKAEKNFMEKNYKEAREFYLKILEEDEKHYRVMTYIGQTYGIEGDMDLAIEWYLKTIEKNYIDYLAHWFLASAYKSEGKLDKALDEITIARILNRNNPRIKQSFDEIYKLNKLKRPEWEFIPQINITELNEHQIKLEYGENWLGYALVKALWLHEPGYKESMGYQEGVFSTLQEKEAFLSLLAGLEKKTIKKNPEFKTLQKAIEEKLLDEFIFYEIVLPDYPQAAYQLPTGFIESIRDYVITMRGEGK